MTTAMKIRPIPTHRAAERSARRKATAEALQASLIDKVATLRDSDEWTRFLDFARSFHRGLTPVWWTP